MFTKLQPVWLVAQRELRDQLRDWRVVMPMAILVFCFPILMDEFSQQAVDFLSQYNTNLIMERLVPFSILIIGFFPITVSLVVALESFVGEKERGTIEPMLSAPLDDWQLYSGKLLVGVVTPLVASYLSIGFYLLMVTRREGLILPPMDATIQLLVLTAAHAFLMVSAAIVISVQSTSVKAANLLASFIVIPVAILMQGETVILVWGDRTVLWLAVIGVTILALLLIRMGIAHFQREYLLGREVDSFNAKWVWRSFLKNFLGGSHSIGEWYRFVFKGSFRRLVPSIIVTVFIAGASLWLGYEWVMQNISDVVAHASPEELAKIERRVDRMPDLANLQRELSASFLFFNNTRAMIAIFIMGLLSFSVLGILLYMINISMIGGLFALLTLLGRTPFQLFMLFLSGILPHGMFEIPALMIGSAATLYFGVVMVTPQVGKSMGEVIIELLADWLKIFIGIVIPLLVAAALVEAYITPLLLVNISSILK
jgi:uncharacterized membrane protein SpoIIM required for sporulation